MSLLAKAIAIAANAHQTHAPDKGGAPYVLHPLRMMFQLESEAERIVAVLHDVIEDHGGAWSFPRLANEGFPPDILEALQGVTKFHEEEDYGAFIRRAAINPVSRRVKLADLEDNMNLLRLQALSDRDVLRLRKYHASWQFLRAVDAGDGGAALTLSNDF